MCPYSQEMSWRQQQHGKNGGLVSCIICPGFDTGNFVYLRPSLVLRTSVVLKEMKPRS
jgi:predicted cupin superfamily sugar epimerase